MGWEGNFSLFQIIQNKVNFFQKSTHIWIPVLGVKWVPAECVPHSTSNPSFLNAQEENFVHIYKKNADSGAYFNLHSI